MNARGSGCRPLTHELHEVLKNKSLKVYFPRAFPCVLCSKIPPINDFHILGIHLRVIRMALQKTKERPEPLFVFCHMWRVNPCVED
jgi:hypothetical protein